MPELPEVETVRRGLEEHIVGQRIVGAKALHPRAMNPKSIAELDAITGAKILKISRRGKFLWFELDRPESLVAHLGMSGQFLINPENSAHTRALFTLSGARKNKVQELHFNDQRTFGWVSVETLNDGVPSSATKIALDPFDKNFDQKAVVANIKRRNVKIKTAILNQNIISGIGNIYADESLWLARVHPESIASNLSTKTISTIIDCAKEVMAKAIEVGGTSFDDLYINVNGESGYFDISLNAYGREDEPCGRCGKLIKRITFANRSSHFCPKCQTLVQPKSRL
jgi:formamidopyrimidine-DNA glycosylase